MECADHCDCPFHVCVWLYNIPAKKGCANVSRHPGAVCKAGPEQVIISPVHIMPSPAADVPATEYHGLGHPVPDRDGLFQWE